MLKNRKHNSDIEIRETTEGRNEKKHLIYMADFNMAKFVKGMGLIAVLFAVTFLTTSYAVNALEINEDTQYDTTVADLQLTGISAEALEELEDTLNVTVTASEETVEAVETVTTTAQETTASETVIEETVETEEETEIESSEETEEETEVKVEEATSESETTTAVETTAATTAVESSSAEITKAATTVVETASEATAAAVQTAAPVQTTAAPAQTTAAPVQTTAAPTQAAVHTHTETRVVVKEATCTANGLAEIRCTECGQVLRSEEIAATGHSFTGLQVVQEASLSTNRVMRNTCTKCGLVAEEQTVSYESVVGSEMAQRGSTGRLVIPEVGYSAATFAPAADWSNLQTIVDAQDSACMFSFYWLNDGNTMIADHCGQGFGAMKNSVPGSTVAYIVTGSGRTAYRCIANCPNGYNMDSYLALSDGTPVGNVYQNSLIMYTCNDSTGYSVTITVWQRI